MMNSIRLQFLNWLSLSITMFLACTMEAVWWPQFFGSIAGPLLWMNVCLYIILYRKPIEAIFINYGLGLIINSYTSMSLGKIWTCLLIMTVLGSYARSRIFWPSLRYFIFASVAMTLTFQITYYSLSNMLDKNPIEIHFFAKVLEVVMTAFLAAPIYGLLKKVDTISQPDPMTEVKAII